MCQPPRNESTKAAALAARLRAALMPDYNRAAALYWWVLVMLGSFALVMTLHALPRALPVEHRLPALLGSLAAMMAALFPIRIPASRQSFVAGEVFVVLQLLSFGPEAAVLCAAGESAVGAASSSRRWTSRLVSPAVAALSMALVGQAFAAIRHAVAPTPQTDAVLVLLAVAACLLHFVTTTLLLSFVVQIKRGQALTCAPLFGSFAWVAMACTASALAAVLLHAAFSRSGSGAMMGALPVVLLLLAMLHHHFRQRESDTRAQAERIAAAEREAAMASRHLEELRASELRFSHAFVHAAVGMALVDEAGWVLQANPALCELLGAGEAELMLLPLPARVVDEDRETLRAQWAYALQGLPTGPQQRRWRRDDGTVLHVLMHSRAFPAPVSDRAMLIVQLQDVTARCIAEANTAHIAYHDALTGLPNRARFAQCLQAAVQRTRADTGCGYALMFLDLDRFKMINDTLGHDAGDAFLRIVAQRLRDQLRPCDMVARLGGDEFAVLVDEIEDEASLVSMAERLHHALARPYLIDGGTELHSSASIGITTGRIGYRDPGEVLRDADIAMYRAKASGRARTVVFDESLRGEVSKRARLEREMLRAIELDQFELVYQPLFDLAAGRSQAVEALVRWRHPELGPLSPAEFIPVAEESGVITRLTDWVLHRACADVARHSRQAGATRVHVNVSGADICRADLVAVVSAALAANALAPELLLLELTETTLMHRLDQALENMRQLTTLGVGLGVDDFGTGYSSLAYLSSLPIGTLKIDRSFVRELGHGSNAEAVVNSILTLGQSLGKAVIAEGIETADQLACLRRLGCASGQGYYLARPMALAQLPGHAAAPSAPAALPAPVATMS